MQIFTEDSFAINGNPGAVLKVPGNIYTVNPNEPITFDGSESYDTDSTPQISYYWWQVDGAYVWQGSTSDKKYFTRTFTLPAGVNSKTYTITLTVRDNEYYTNTKVITITVHNGKGRTEYYLTDHLGSIRTTIDDQGKVLGYDDYDPFGNVLPGRSSNAGTPNDLNKFTGHERDQEESLNLDYTPARIYDGEQGRFYGVDPLASKYPNLSPYAYVANNPMIAIDPDRRDIWFVHGTFSRPNAFGLSTQLKFSSLLNDYTRHSFDWQYRSWTNTKWGRKSAAEELADNITERTTRILKCWFN